MRFASCAACLKGIRLALVGLLATVSELDIDLTDMTSNSPCTYEPAEEA